MANPHGAPLTLARRDGSGSFEAILCRPRDAHTLLVLAHGAGAGMRHVFLESLAGALAGERIATLRYEFPYMARGRRRPDPPQVATAAVRDAVAAAGELAAASGIDRPVFASGKSFGGRMTSTAEADEALGVGGLVFFGFPLHPAGRPSVDRAEHLARIERPMLFLQGDRDRLADLRRLRPVLRDLGERAELRVVEGADHGFHVLKRSGRTDEEVIAELAHRTARWIEAVSRAR